MPDPFRDARPRLLRQLRLLVLTGMVVATFAAWVPIGRIVDFATYYTAGLLTREGTPEQAFNQGEINQRYHQLPVVPVKIGPFLYSPFYLLPAAAFASLPLAAARQANHALTIVCLGLLLYLLLRTSRRWWSEVLYCLIFLFSYVVGVQFQFQNWSFLLVPLVALAWWATEARRWIWAALVWALAIHLKVVVVLFLVPLALAGRRRLVVATVAATLALGAASITWGGWSSQVRWARTLVGASAGGVTPFFNKISLQATVARFSSPPTEWVAPSRPVSTAPVRWLFWASLPVYLLVVWHLRRREERALAFTIPYLLLFIPQTWTHSELLLLLALPVLPLSTSTFVACVVVASAVYPAALREILSGALHGEVRPGVARAALCFFPVLNTLVGAALVSDDGSVGAGDGASEREEDGVAGSQAS